MLAQEESLHQLSSQVLHSIQERKHAARLGIGPTESQSAPIVRLANQVIDFGIELRASDIHISPLEDRLRLRYRVDGALWECREAFPLRLHSMLVSRLKVMAGMDISEHRRPADGHIAYACAKGKVDLRVASLPVKYGEAIAIRILNAEKHLRCLGELGLSEQNEKLLRQLVHRPSGMLIACGPMNSGKTTSLYAILQELNSPELNIMTIEDPVEGVIDGINQIEVNPKAGLGFAEGLRAILRMDANAIMVGEIRDETTAQIAVRAALTGHLLITTLHARDSITALFRLLEMGIPAYLLAATLSGIVAQRLVRRLCPFCRESHEVIEGSTEAALLQDSFCTGKLLWHGNGCDACHGTGFLGRLPLHEILSVDDEIRHALLHQPEVADIESLARGKGFRTMWEDGVAKAMQGSTTLEEVGRVLYAH